ncbi:hypothetical protein WKW82_38960 [Variovorax rhizosphaerae]|uniref:Uncharacterized protein n=1 Tax=Variovorax rhizosphaerae TaxID=1836200 RepID=A0ABU8WYZ5_9BURK
MPAAAQRLGLGPMMLLESISGNDAPAPRPSQLADPVGIARVARKPVVQMNDVINIGSAPDG